MAAEAPGALLDSGGRMTAIRYRLGDPNLLPSEAARLEKLASGGSAG